MLHIKRIFSWLLRDDFVLKHDLEHVAASKMRRYEGIRRSHRQ